MVTIQMKSTADYTDWRGSRHQRHGMELDHIHLPRFKTGSVFGDSLLLLIIIRDHLVYPRSKCFDPTADSDA